MYVLINKDSRVLCFSRARSAEFTSVEVSDEMATEMRTAIKNTCNYTYNSETNSFTRVKKATVPDWSDVRKNRDLLITIADNYAKILYDKQILGEDVSEKVQEVAVYRNALRMIPQTYASPEVVVWPDNSFMYK